MHGKSACSRWARMGGMLAFATLLVEHEGGSDAALGWEQQLLRSKDGSGLSRIMVLACMEAK
jgi:hypothetical protein